MSVKPRVLFDLKIVTFTEFVNIACACVVIVLLSLCLSQVWGVTDKDSSSSSTENNKHSTANANGFQSNTLFDDNTQVSAYQCRIPDSYTARSLSQYSTWIVMGNDFVTAQSVESPWYQMLGDKLKVRPTVLMAAGQFSGNLTLQAQWLQAQPEYRHLISNHQGALIFLSNGLEWLLQNPGQPLSVLDRDLQVLLEGDNPVVPLQYRSSFPVLLMSPPNPLQGALWIDPVLARCSAPYSIFNQATSYDQQRLISAQQAMRTSYEKMANRYSLALLDLNQALGQHSLGLAPTLQQSAIAPNCRSYSQLGQMMLADLVYQCAQHLPYELQAL